MKITVNVGEKRSFPLGEAYKVSTPHVSATWEYEAKSGKEAEVTKLLIQELQGVIDGHISLLERRYNKNSLPDREFESNGVKWRTKEGKYEYYSEKEGVWKSATTYSP